MIHLVKEMTMLAKIEADDREISKESVSLRKITEEVTESLANELREKGMKTVVVGAVDAFVNQDKFKQIILNLLDNAISHGRKDNDIRIEMRNSDGKAVWSIGNLADTLFAGEVVHVFDRFYRAEKGRPYDDRKQHLGIGLNIVRKLIEAHGGGIDARMEDGEVIFTITV